MDCVAGFAIKRDCYVAGDGLVAGQPSQIFGMRGRGARSGRVCRFHTHNDMVFSCIQGGVRAYFTNRVTVAVRLINKMMVMGKQCNAPIQATVSKDNTLSALCVYIDVRLKRVMTARQMRGMPLVNAACAATVGKNLLSACCTNRIEASNTRTERVNLITAGLFVEESLKFFQFFGVTLG